MPFAAIRYIDAYPVSDSMAFIDPSDGGDYTAVTVMRGLMDGVAVKGKVWKRAWYHCTDEMLALDFDAFALATNEGREAMTCPACDQEFWVQGGYIPHYTTAFAEELLDEELLD